MGLPIGYFDQVPTFNSITELVTKLHTDGCRRCELGLQPGINGCCVSKGNPSAKMMILGEAPGKTEDRTKVPFSGPAGQLLDRILLSVGLNPDDYYFSNSILCRPVAEKGSGKENFTPRRKQIERCRPFLEAQLKLLNPKIVLLLGKIATDTILELFTQNMSECRGKLYTKNSRDYFVMLHPAYILHQQNINKEAWLKARKDTWEDIQKLKSILIEKGIINESQKATNSN